MLENLAKWCEKIDAACEMDDYYYSAGDGREWVSVAAIDNYCFPKLHISVHPNDKPNNPTKLWRDFCFRSRDFYFVVTSLEMFGAVDRMDLDQFIDLYFEVSEFKPDWKIFRTELREKTEIFPRLKTRFFGHRRIFEVGVDGIIKFGLTNEMAKNWEKIIFGRLMPDKTSRRIQQH